MLATIHADLPLLFVLLAFACLCAAGYCAWMRNLPAAFALVCVAIVAVVLASE